VQVSRFSLSRDSEGGVSGLSGEPVFVAYGPGQFSGEVVLISVARALSRGRVAEPGEFLEISADALRTLIAKDAELSDIFMRAFFLRRVAMISGGLGNVAVLGLQHSSNTLRLREFLIVGSMNRSMRRSKVAGAPVCAPAGLSTISAFTVEEGRASAQAVVLSSRPAWASNRLPFSQPVELREEIPDSAVNDQFSWRTPTKYFEPR
jgi:hypothetical protein